MTDVAAPTKQAPDDELLVALRALADSEFAVGMQRYFPHPILALGVSNAAVVDLAKEFLAPRVDLSPAMRLAIANRMIASAQHHEEVLLGFALLHKTAKRNLGPELLDHCLMWLEGSVTNWAQCDDLCLKLLYPFFCGHLELLPVTRNWVESDSPWARRAANVALVKFVRRQVGRVLYELPLSHVFGNCDRLLHDEDDYVQKGCGWLLKVAAAEHPEEVAAFLRERHAEMKRDTFRYAIEKMAPEQRQALLALGKG